MNEPNGADRTSHKRKRPHKRNPETVKRKNKERKARRRKLEKEFNIALIAEAPTGRGLVAQVEESEMLTEEEIEENEAEKTKEGDHSNKRLTTKAMFKVRKLLFLRKTPFFRSNEKRTEYHECQEMC